MSSVWRSVRQTPLIAGLVVAGATFAMGAQSGQTPPPSTSTTAPGNVDKTMVLIGCVQGDATGADRFTLSNPKAGTTYRLSGTNVQNYIGRRVRIVGGLVPSPNIAAQAGAIDPTRAAMAAAGGNLAGTGNVQPVEVRVIRVRPLTGPCSAR